MFTAEHAPSLVVVSRGCSSLLRTGVSSHWLPGAWALGILVSAVGVLSNSEKAELLLGMQDLPRPGMQPMSPALEGGFLSTRLPGNPYFFLFLFFPFLSIFLKFFSI